MAVGCGVLLATMASGPWSRADERTESPATSGGCLDEPVAEPGGPSAGVGQVVTVEVPAIAVIDLVAGAPQGAWTNSGRPPTSGDELYVRRSDGLVEAPSTIEQAVHRAAWLPVAGQGCEASSWVVAAPGP